MQLEHVGLNHLSWERTVLVDGVDRLPELIDGHADAIAEEIDLPGDSDPAACGAIPSYYLRYYYFATKVLDDEPRTSAREPRRSWRSSASLLEMYRDPALDVKPKLLEERGGAFYSEAAAMLIASLHGDRGDVQVVNTSATTARSRTCPTTRSSRWPPDRPGGGAPRSRSIRSPPRCSAWSSTPRPTSG